MSAHETIARCTIDGHVRWQHVAAQLGRCVDSVRAEHDPTYLRSHIWALSREPQPEMLDIDTTDLTSSRSPHIKGPPLRIMVLARLRMGSASAETIAAFIAKPIGSVKNALTELHTEGEVQHTIRTPYTWSVRQRDASVAGEAA